MARPAFENLHVYALSEKLADGIWDIVIEWPNFAKFSVGKQLVRSADSIGANISEGVGRGTYQDNRRFVRFARGSLNETQHWLRAHIGDKLLTDAQTATLKPVVDELGPRLNAYLKSIGRSGKPENADEAPPEASHANDREEHSTDNRQLTTDN